MPDFVVHQEEYKGFVIKIVPDNDSSSSNPVEDWDMLGKQVYWHRRYNLGHCHKETSRYSPEEWLESEIEMDGQDSYEHWEKYYSRKMGYMPFLLMKFSENNLVIPVHAYEHGGITISASGRRAGWDSFDSSQLGFVYVSHKDILKNYSKKRLTKKILEHVEKMLIMEVNEYDSYLRGEVYGFQIFENGDSDDSLESVYGFVGDYEYCLSEAKSLVDYLAEHREKELQELDKRMVG